jgi:hypothetical protein
MVNKQISEEAVTIVSDGNGKPEVMIRRSKEGGVDVFMIDMMGVDKVTKFLELLVSIQKQVVVKEEKKDE